MRIENLLTEIHHPSTMKGASRRQASEGKAVAKGGKDAFVPSRAGSVLAQAQVEDVRQSRIDEIRHRVKSGYYDKPEVRLAIADALISSGMADPVLAEVQEIKITRKKMMELPDVRERKVVEAKQRVEDGFYKNVTALTGAAENFLDSNLV